MTVKSDSSNAVLSPDLPILSSHHTELLRKIRVILVEPRHPGNIGSTARAMNVSGLTRLYLVNPVPGWRGSDDARMFACGSHDVLNSAIETETLQDALDGAVTAVGTTHRMGRGRGPMLPPRKLAEHLPGILRDGDVALVFGREDKGLANDELALCNMGVHIPTAADYPSLNLSHAVMVVAYECFYAVLSVAEPDAENTEPTYPAVAALAERVCGLTERTGFIHRRGRVGFERSLRQTIQRSGINTRDLTLVHLVCRHLERYMGGLERGLTPEEARAAQSEDVERESGGTSD